MKTNPTMQAEAVLPTRPVSENGKINILTRLAYGGGDVACNVVYGMIATLLTLFYTDYAGVSVATVGLVMLISRFFDGGSDVVMGFIVDRTHSKWGLQAARSAVRIPHGPVPDGPYHCRHLHHAADQAVR